MTLRCPACDLPMRLAALAVAGRIEGAPYVMLVCARCQARLRRLPGKARDRWLSAAENRISKAPARYAVRACESDAEAHILVALTADPAAGPEAIRTILEAA
jgi:hypothetical protein